MCQGYGGWGGFLEKKMTRILVQRGSAGSSSNQNRSPLPGSSSASASQLFAPQIPSTSKDEEQDKEVQNACALDGLHDCCGSNGEKTPRNDDVLSKTTQGIKNEVVASEFSDKEKDGIDDGADAGTVVQELSGLQILEKFDFDESEGSGVGCSHVVSGSSQPPPPPVPPPKPFMANLSSRRTVSGGSSAPWIGSSRRAVAWPVVSTRTSPSASHPSSPRSYGEAEGYNSADEQNSCFGSSYDDAVSTVFFLLKSTKLVTFVALVELQKLMCALIIKLLTIGDGLLKYCALSFYTLVALQKTILSYSKVC